MHSVRENVGDHHLAAARRGARLASPPGADTRARSSLSSRKLEVRTPSLSQSVGNLSGGNQQKVSRSPSGSPPMSTILIIDEPTVGIDIKTKAYLHELIARDRRRAASRSSSSPATCRRWSRSPTASSSCTASGVKGEDHRYETTSKAIMSRIHAVEEPSRRRPHPRQPSRERRHDMAKIERVEVLMVDLKPKVKRTDAIQSFVSQETPIVRIFDDDGAVGTGYTYTIGTGGHAVIELLARTLAPGADRPRSATRSRRSGATSSSTPMPPPSARSPRWRSRRSTRRCGTCAAARPGCRSTSMAGGAQESRAALHDRRRLAAHRDRGARRGCARAPRRRGFGGCKIKVGRPPHEDVARLAAVREAVGDGLRDHDRRQPGASTSTRRSAARGSTSRSTSPGSRSRCRPRTSAAMSASPRSTSLPIAVGESLYSLLHFREYLQRGACSIVQVDVGAHRRHHALAEDGASRRERSTSPSARIS